MILRSLGPDDATAAIRLYRTLNPDVEIAGPDHFATLVSRTDTTVIGADISNEIVAMATLHILPNMTYGGRPFGVIENVITLAQFRNQGTMRAVFQELHRIAWAKDAYKIMLMTGTDTGAKVFYEKLGYSGDQKHGLQIRRVPPRKG